MQRKYTYSVLIYSAKGKSMNSVLILGSGGREHALAWKLKREGIYVYAYPGNPGIFGEAEKTDIKDNTFEAIAQFAEQKSIDLVIIGPEQYLADGLTDYLIGRGLNVFGPSLLAARIETDKSYAKSLMKRMNVNTAGFSIVSGRNEFMDSVKGRTFPYVVKVSGLAAGKGAYVINTDNELDRAFRDIFDDMRFKDAAEHIIIEDFLDGEELSLFVITDGSNALPMLPAQDYKRAYDGDKGLNTGGMGSFAPYGRTGKSDIGKIMEEIINPVLTGMKNDGNAFRGLLYAGLMKNGSEFSVVEFNARFGDPETQSVLYLMKNSLFDIMMNAAKGHIGPQICDFEKEYAATVIMAAQGYPLSYDKGMQIHIDDIDNNTYIFHAGTKSENGQLLTSGGRILGVTSKDKSLENALNRVYTNIENIHIDKSFYRKDIAYRGLRV